MLLSRIRDATEQTSETKSGSAEAYVWSGTATAAKPSSTRKLSFAKSWWVETIVSP